MTTAGRPRPADPPTLPVRAALERPDVVEKLRRHAEACLAVLLRDRPKDVRGDAARDAVQEACRRGLAREADYRPCRAGVPAWLHGILEHVLSEQCRALRKLPLQPALQPEQWDALEARLAAPDHEAALRPLLARLAEADRAIVTMHHIDGMGHEQIAAALGITPGCSRVRLARAMAALRMAATAEGEQ